MIGLEVEAGELGDLEGVLLPFDIALSSIVLIAPKVAPVGVRPLWRPSSFKLETAVSSDMSDEPSGRATL
jgi:hypothetical protein